MNIRYVVVRYSEMFRGNVDRKEVDSFDNVKKAIKLKMSIQLGHYDWVVIEVSHN